MLSILEKVKETLLDFAQGSAKVLEMCYRIMQSLI